MSQIDRRRPTGVSRIVRALSTGWWVRPAILIGALLATALVVGPVAYWRAGLPGVFSAGVACVTCLVSGLLALWLVQMSSGPEKSIQQVLLGMAPRMGIPLTAVVIVQLIDGTLANSGFAYYLLAFYFITLAIETVLMARSLPDRPTESQVG
jgi:hypothetical protein